MTGAGDGKSAKKTEIGLVLQGGGALGAYEYGGITALLELMEQAKKNHRQATLKAVTGVSIGAINAACLVGSADYADARRRLGTLWNAFTIKAPAFLPAALSGNFALYHVPHFYTFLPSWTYLYNTQELLTTLPTHVDFAALNRSDTAFVITAVDVKSGELTRFANKKVGHTEPTTIKPEHVLASGSLPPQFPWTEIGDGANAHYYWDGGIVDNTPLGDAIDAFSPGDDINRLLVVMNLFPVAANLPTSFTQVNDRVNQLRFGNRLRQDTENAIRINDLIATIEALVKLVPAAELAKELAEKASAHKRVTPIEISLSPDQNFSDADGFRDFSSDGIERRRKAGHETAFKTLLPFF
jgi:predicted acylesterase/phospholipase RssA